MKVPCRWRALLFIAAVMLSGCVEQASDRSILPADVRLRAGDVVFRRGGSVLSRSVVALDAKGKYSHVGIVVDSAGQAMVIHAVPQEPDFEGDPDRVKMDPPERFFSIRNAVVGEVCRMQDSLAAEAAAREAWRLYRKRLLFDHDYDGEDSTRMYCTELVASAYERAGVGLLTGSPRHIDLPGLRVECYFPSDIYESGLLESVRKFSK